MNVLIALQDKWLDYCRAMNAPCIPPDKHADATVGLIIGVFISIGILLSVMHYAVTRLRIATSEEFRRANDRLQLGIPLLVSVQGKELRHLCREISRDLIQVTGFAEMHVSRCFHENHWWGGSRMASMILFMAENRRLRTDAVFIAIFYLIPLFMKPLVMQTNASARRYCEEWLILFEQYKIENPECQNYF